MLFKPNEVFFKPSAAVEKASSLCEKRWSLEEKQRTFARKSSTRAKGSELDLQTVVGIGHAFGQLSVGFTLSPGLVTHVDEIGVRSSDASCHGDGLFECLVRVVRFGTQSAHHQRAHAQQFRPFACRAGRKGRSYRPNRRCEIPQSGDVRASHGWA